MFQGQLYHPSIIQLLGHYIDRERETTYMILEYADGGTLFDKLREQVLEKPEIKRYFQEVCQAVAYLHENEIMHRDIKVLVNLRSRKTSSSAARTGPSSATSGSPPSWASARPSAALTSTCRPKWSRTSPTTTRSTSGRWASSCSK